MDVKGVTWFGDVYQKFETMCLEVEEAVCQDTVKYVENQVQTVGASVKKFYSEVVDDLLSPSLMDPVKVNSLPCTGAHKKPKMGIKEEPKKQLFEDRNATPKVYKHSAYGSSYDRFSNTDPAVPCNLVNSSDELSSKFTVVSKSTSGASNKLKLVIKRKPKSVTAYSTEVPKTTNPTAINPSKKPQGSGALTVENHEAPTDQIFEQQLDPDPDAVYCDFKETEGKTGDGNQNNLKLKQTTDALVKPIKVVLPGESVGCRPKESVKGSSFENKEWFKSTHLTEDQGTLTNIFPSDSSPGPNGETDGWNIETITSDDDVEEDTETVDMIFNIQAELEESCVIVDRENLPLNFDKEPKHKSYKKKFRDAFLSRGKLMRKKEYRQLAAHYESATNVELDQHNASNSLHTTSTSELKKLKSVQLCESEWEIV